MRAIFDAALAFSKNSRGGNVPIGERQSVADLLIDIKMRTETSRSVIIIGEQTSSANDNC
jgi:alkylation response protein AidB-like acyl-CoA dehydrogenase